jgi:uncharacterized phage protein (TIGR01671 family)
LKFRAWDKKTKKMREVDSVAFHNMRSAGDYDKSNLPKVYNLWGFDIIDDKDVICHREANEVILEQFTGLRDKNGKEIYEGDILRREEEEPGEFEAEIYYDYGIVKWDNSAWWIVFLYSGEDISLDDYFSETGEVIGNIHENRELLEEA